MRQFFIPPPLHRSLLKSHHHHDHRQQQQQLRRWQYRHLGTFPPEPTQIKWGRDRGLDHAVEKERNLKPLLSMKNLILSEPSRSLPLSAAADLRSRLSIPTRPIDFFRLYPSVFLEHPASDSSSPLRPRISLSPAVLLLHESELSARLSSRPDVADRLLKLLMLSPPKRLPLPLLDLLRFDLGLPDDYLHSLLPEFPDYFRLVPSPNGSPTAVELVCWTKDLAVSALQNTAAAAASSKGDSDKPIKFPLRSFKGFEMEKKVKMWLDEWQKLPYISPYEEGSHLAPRTDAGEKWAVGVLHEILHLMIPKKTEKENILALGEYMGLRARFKRAMAEHPWIFYVSNKLRTQTVVLKEAYKRDLLVEKHPLMEIRYQYIHLMNKKETEASAASSDGSLDKAGTLGWEEDELDDEADDEDECEPLDSEDEDEISSNDADEMEQFERSRGTRRNGRRQSIEMKENWRTKTHERSTESHADKKHYGKSESHKERNVDARAQMSTERHTVKHHCGRPESHKETNRDAIMHGLTERHTDERRYGRPESHKEPAHRSTERHTDKKHYGRPQSHKEPIMDARAHWSTERCTDKKRYGKPEFHKESNMDARTHRSTERHTDKKRYGKPEFHKEPNMDARTHRSTERH